MKHTLTLLALLISSTSFAHINQSNVLAFDGASKISIKFESNPRVNQTRSYNDAGQHFQLCTTDADCCMKNPHLCESDEVGYDVTHLIKAAYKEQAICRSSGFDKSIPACGEGCVLESTHTHFPAAACESAIHIKILK